MLKSLSMACLSLFLGASVLNVGCKPAGSGTAPGAGSSSGSAPDPKATVAKIGGQPITEAELTAEAKPQLTALETELAEKTHQTRVQALDALIAKRLIEAKAKAEGLTTEALIDREVTSKVPEPDPAMVQQVYDRTKASGRPVPPFDQVRGEIVRFMKQQQAEQTRAAFVDKLKSDAKVEVLLPPLLLPKVQVAAEGPAKGDDKAPVTIIEFSDFQCPFCSRAEETVKKVLDAYKGKIRLVYREFPLPFHDKAEKASEAALCAADQSKYWEMHEKLFANQNALDVPQLKDYAKGLGLDSAKFGECLDSGAKAKIVDASKKAGEAVGVNGTPAFFINGRPLSGAQPFEKFKEVIDYELAAAGG